MKEYYIRLLIDAENRIRLMAHLTRDEAVMALLAPRRIRHGAFVIDGDDEGDVLLLKRAVEGCGGVRHLAYRLGVSRETLYNWKNRGVIPTAYRERMIESAERRDDGDEPCAD